MLKILMTAKVGFELFICTKLMLSGVVGPMTEGTLHHRAMDGVTLAVLSILLLPPGEDIIQGLLPLLFINSV